MDFPQSPSEWEVTTYWICATLAYTDPRFAFLKQKYPMTPALLAHCLHICQVNNHMNTYRVLSQTYQALHKKEQA